MGELLNADATERFDIGRHAAVIEPSGVLHIAFRGETSLDEVKGMQAVMYAHGDRVGPYDFLLDATKLDSLEAGARSAWVRVERRYPFRAVYVYGASFAARTIVTTVLRAGRLLAPRFFDWSMEFFATEQEARAAIEARRRGEAG